jgi:hypothetical protein
MNYFLKSFTQVNTSMLIREAIEKRKRGKNGIFHTKLAGWWSSGETFFLPLVIRIVSSKNKLVIYTYVSMLK